MAVIVGRDKIGQVVNGYKISILIEDDHGDVWDYEPDTKAIRIISSFKSKYPIFVIKLDLKPIEVINHSILGQHKIILNIDFVDNSIPTMEPFNLELMYLSGDFDFPISNTLLTNKDSMQDQVPYTMRAVPAIPFALMTTTINNIYKNINPLLCLEQLINTTGELAGLDKNSYNLQADTIDYSCKINKSVLDQIIFPPTILANHIDYLFDEYGIFPGYGVFFSNLNEGDNKFYLNIMSLNHRLYSEFFSPAFSITQLANDSDNIDIVKNMGEDGNYYTYFGIHTNYIGNTSFSNNGMNLFYVDKPVDKFYRLNKDSISPDEVIPRDKEAYLYHNEILTNRDIYNTSHICYNRDEKNTDKYQDDDWVRAQISRSVLNLTQVKIKLERNLPLHKFTNIGQTVNFESKTNEYTIFNGKYIFFNSDIVLSRKSEWQCTCDLTLIRPKWDI